MSEQSNPIEAEVIPTQAVAVRQESGMATISQMEQKFALAVRQRELLADYIKKQLKPGKHFYEVKGQTKKSLTKEGAEIILLPHNFVPDYDIVSGPEAPPEADTPYQITIKCTLRANGNPNSFVGSGIGSAGSHKGTWKDNRWTYQPRQTDKYLCHNATMKMAQKSAMIAATINSTAASEFFTQDMEPETQQGPPPAAAQPKPAEPKEKVPPSPASCLKRLMVHLIENNIVENAHNYLMDLGWLKAGVPMEKLEEKYIPTLKEDYVNFIARLTEWAVTGKAVVPYPPKDPNAPKPIEVPRDENCDPNSPSAPWRSFPMTHGTHAGIPLAELDKGYLYGLWANFEVQTEFKGRDGKMRPCKPEQIEKAKKLRKMLDEAQKHYGFTKKD